MQGLGCRIRLHFEIYLALAFMIITWIAIGISGAALSFFACRVVAFPDRALRKMAIVFGLLLACFLLSPLIRIPLQHLFPTPTWRLFGIYGYAAVFAIAVFGTSFLYMSAKLFKLRSCGSQPRKDG
jgi:hypothetical protein